MTEKKKTNKINNDKKKMIGYPNSFFFAKCMHTFA